MSSIDTAYGLWWLCISKRSLLVTKIVAGAAVAGKLSNTRCICGHEKDELPVPVGGCAGGLSAADRFSSRYLAFRRVLVIMAA